MPRSPSVLDTSRGRKSIVRPVGTALVDRIVPLITTLEPVSGFHQVFEMRLAIEVPSAALAATRRTADDWARLEEPANEYAARNDDDIHRYRRANPEFHLKMALATRNPIFTGKPGGCRDGSCRR